MKKIIMAIICAAFFALPAAAQGINDKADNIIGEYLTDRGGSKSKVRVTKNADGTYDAQVFWVENPMGKDGKKRKDVKNPDKSLRSTPADRSVIFSGLKYDARKHEWNGTKIYDPQRGVRAKLVAEFADDGRLALTGSVLVISETVYWKKIK